MMFSLDSLQLYEQPVYPEGIKDVLYTQYLQGNKDKDNKDNKYLTCCFHKKDSKAMV